MKSLFAMHYTPLSFPGIVNMKIYSRCCWLMFRTLDKWVSLLRNNYTNTNGIKTEVFECQYEKLVHLL